MSNYNQNSGYGSATLHARPSALGKVFFLSDSTGQTMNRCSQIFTPDPDGQVRTYTTWAAISSSNVTKAGRGDLIIVAPDFVGTAPTSGAIKQLEDNGVTVINGGGMNPDGTVTVYKTSTLTSAGTTGTALFSVLGPVKVIDLQGTFMTSMSATATTLQILSSGAFNDYAFSAVGSITSQLAGAVVAPMFCSTGGILSPAGSTGAMQVSSGGTVMQMWPSVIINTYGTTGSNIVAVPSAASTGITYVKWTVNYKPMGPNGIIIPAST